MTKHFEQIDFITGTLIPTYFADHQIVEHWGNYIHFAVYIIIHKETGRKYIGRTNRPLSRIYKHIVGNTTNTNWFINENTWKDFNFVIVPVTSGRAACDLERALVESVGRNSYNLQMNTSIGYKSTKKPVTVNGIKYPSVIAAAKALNVYPVKLYKKATISNNFNI
jgi:predicted GIY-YIG superfamily endonuclease